MEKKTLKQRIKENPGLKQAVHRFTGVHLLNLAPPGDTALRFHRPETRKGFFVIYRSVRKDLLQPTLQYYSVVERISLSE